MISTKRIELKKKTITITLEGSSNELCNLDKYEAVSIALLTGYYNPMRRFSENDSPIDIKTLYKFKDQFKDLVSDVIGEMNVDVESITKA